MIQRIQYFKFVASWFACLSASAALLAPVDRAEAADAAALNAARNSITSAELKKHVDTLADDTFEGREAGSRGGRAAAGYVAGFLKRYGLKGAGDDGTYFQSFGNGYRNILALLEGSDPHLKQEVVLVGAHYDHVGYGNAGNSYGPIGYIHNGADDNASGSAGLLELIEAFGKLPEPPRRTILFAFWDGEEKGLLGSEHFVARPTIPLSRIRAAINMDMIGRLRKERLEVFGTRTAVGLRRLVADQNRDIGLNLDFTWEMTPNSDHYTFFAKRIPILMLHTGLHDDYHRPSDDADKVNAEGMQQVSRLLFNVTYALADATDLPGFRNESRGESEFTQMQFEQPLRSLPPRLGVSWKRRRPGDPPASPGLEVVEVTKDSAADKAGIRVGDRLLQCDGRDIIDPEAFVGEIVTADGPIELTVAREGDDEPLQLKVELDGNPVRVGVNWRQDPADPGTAMLTRVVPGSPAARAGLRVRDRLREVGGQRFADSKQLTELLTTLPSPLEVRIERNGRLETLELDLPPPQATAGE